MSKKNDGEKFKKREWGSIEEKGDRDTKNQNMC
jgi:hypothetical protein